MFCLAINSTNNATRNQKLASFGGLLLLGFRSSHKKLTLISGGCYYRNSINLCGLIFLYSIFLNQCAGIVVYQQQQVTTTLFVVIQLEFK